MLLSGPIDIGLPVPNVKKTSSLSTKTLMQEPRI